LDTERLVLRRFTPDDVDNLVELDCDPEVMHFITGGRVTAREENENALLSWCLRYDEQGDRNGFWVAIEKATGMFLGWFRLQPADGRPTDEPEPGYRLRRSAWGRG
jgi:RimJ/RimL family protein N-acetyltransferase